MLIVGGAIAACGILYNYRQEIVEQSQELELLTGLEGTDFAALSVKDDRINAANDEVSKSVDVDEDKNKEPKGIMGRLSNLADQVMHVIKKVQSSQD